MTAVLAAALLALAILDGAFAGFRSSAGRTGLISHRRHDRQAARRGAGLACVLLSRLASALVLGPFTLFRPGIAILGAAVGMALGRDVVTAFAAVLSAIAVVAAEPLAGRLWYIA
jgi:hypothetical protein